MTEAWHSRVDARHSCGIRRGLTPVGTRRGERALSYFGAVATVALCLLFVAFWWNRYLGVTNDGWHFFYAQQILRGKIPYRDFYLFVPPLLPLENAAAIKLFGDRLIAPQIAGIAEVAVLGLALYSWLRRLFPVFYAMLASMLSMTIYLQCSTETLSGLHEIAVLYPVLAGLVASFALERDGDTLRYPWLAGLLAGVAFVGKQTSGIGITLSLLVLLPALLGYLKGPRAAIRGGVAFIVGWLMPVGAICIWLGANHALRDFATELFVKGPSSKGSALDMMLRPARMIAEGWYLRKHAILAAIMLASAALLCRKRPRDGVEDRWNRMSIVIAVAVGTLAAVVLAVFFSRSVALRLPEGLKNLSIDVAVLFGEAGSLALFLYYSWILLKRELTDEQAQYLLLAGVSFATAFLMSFSWGIYVSMLIPGFPFVMAFAIWRLGDTSLANAAKSVIVVASLVCIVEIAWLKLNTPFAWAGWREPNVKYASATLPYPELQGLHMSPQTAQFVARVTEEIDAHSTPSQAVFVYPHIPIFYILSHRLPSSFAYVHFIDVAPDYVATADAQKLLQNPPAVIVDFEHSDLREGERIFREGKPSGQRDVVAAINQLSKSYRSETLVAPFTGKTVRILVQSKD